jgi:hypothetical protein
MRINVVERAGSDNHRRYQAAARMEDMDVLELVSIREMLAVPC